MTADLTKLGEIGSTLRRVKAADRPQDDGSKKVWHQGAKGTEVLSFVNSQGRVTRQEIYVPGGLVIWSAGNPIITGKLLEDPPRIGIAMSEQILADPRPRLEPLVLAIAVLKGAPKGDRYLAHLMSELKLAEEGLEGGWEKSVTSQRVVLREPVAVTETIHLGRRWVGWLVGAVGVLAIAAWWLFSHHR